MPDEKTGQPKKSIKEIFLEGTAIDEALTKAARQAVLEHKREGLPLVVWRDGQIVWVPAEELEGPEAGQAAASLSSRAEPAQQAKPRDLPLAGAETAPTLHFHPHEIDMAEPLLQEPVPLATDPDGVIRVGGTRVTLDTVSRPTASAPPPSRSPRTTPPSTSATCTP